MLKQILEELIKSSQSNEPVTANDVTVTVSLPILRRLVNALSNAEFSEIKEKVLYRIAQTTNTNQLITCLKHELEFRELITEVVNFTDEVIAEKYNKAPESTAVAGIDFKNFKLNGDEGTLNQINETVEFIKNQSQAVVEDFYTYLKEANLFSRTAATIDAAFKARGFEIPEQAQTVRR